MALIRECDRCKSTKDVERKEFYIDRKMDAAGSMEDETEGYDLCKNCIILLYEKTVLEMAKRQQPNFPKGYSGPMLARVAQEMIENARKASKNS